MEKLALPVGTFYLEADGQRHDFTVKELTEETNEYLAKSDRPPIEKCYLLRPNLPAEFSYRQLLLRAEWADLDVSFDDNLSDEFFCGASWFVASKVVGLVNRVDNGELDEHVDSGQGSLIPLAYVDVDERFRVDLNFLIVYQSQSAYQADELSLFFVADQVCYDVAAPVSNASEVLGPTSYYFYCQVCFYPGQKAYHYLSADESLKEGDLVIVPVGSNNNLQVGQVVACANYPATKVPYPLLQTKQVLRRANEAEQLDWWERQEATPQGKQPENEAEFYLKLGAQAYSRAEYELAKEYYQQAVVLGSSQAACNLGYIYAYGRLGQPDYEQAFYCFTQAALATNPNGSYKLGDAYFHGQFVAVNMEIAFKYYRQAEIFLARDGSDDDLKADIYYRLARAYHQGLGVEANELAALDYINQAQLYSYVDEQAGRFKGTKLRQEITQLQVEVLANLNQVQTKIALTLGDITKQNDVEVIVNAANKSLLGGGGVDGAIHKAAGPQLLAECRQLNGCQTGQAKITGAYNLPNKYVIHTVGPIWNGGAHGEADLLAACYENSLRLAQKTGLKTIAFPAISTGIYRYPLEEASQIALATVRAFVKANPGAFELIKFVLFDQTALDCYYRKLGGLQVEL